MAGEYVSDNAYDAALDYIANNCERVAICTSAPANYAGIAAVTVAEFTVDSSDFSKAAGDTSGRKLVLAAQSGATASGTGTATHFACHDNASELLAVNELEDQVVTSGNTVNLASVDVTEIRDATAA